MVTEAVGLSRLVHALAAATKSAQSAGDNVWMLVCSDVHYVNNFFPFGSNWVPRYSVSLGYSFGKE
jgi:hypothetical protein